MKGKHFVCIDLRACLYHGKEHVAETSGQMQHKITSETISDQDCAKAQEHCAVLCWPSSCTGLADGALCSVLMSFTDTPKRHEHN